jgi:hypothetical protein
MSKEVNRKITSLYQPAFPQSLMPLHKNITKILTLFLVKHFTIQSPSSLDK